MSRVARQAESIGRAGRCRGIGATRSCFPASVRTGVALVLSVATWPLAAPASAGRVTFLDGVATRAPPGGAATALAVGSAVEAFDLLETRPAARLEVSLSDDSVLRLAGNARVIVAEATATERGFQVRLTLVLGAVWARVAGRLAGEEGFQVRTDRVVAGVRGTEFVVDASEAHAVVVLEGRVVVGAPSGAMLGGAQEHSVGPLEAIRVAFDGRTEGVVGIGGRHDFDGLIAWVRKFEWDRSRDPSEGPRRPTWLERRERRLEIRGERRRDARLLGR